MILMPLFRCQRSTSHFTLLNLWRFRWLSKSCPDLYPSHWWRVLPWTLRSGSPSWTWARFRSNPDAKNQLSESTLFLPHRAKPHGQNCHQRHKLFLPLAGEFHRELSFCCHWLPSTEDGTWVFCWLDRNASWCEISMSMRWKKRDDNCSECIY